MTQGKSPRNGRLYDELVDLACAEAAHGTIHDISIPELARRIGVTPEAVYRHFPNRNAILIAVAGRGFDMLAKRFRIAVDPNAPAASAEEAIARFEALAFAYVSFAQDYFGLWRLMFGIRHTVDAKEPVDRPSSYSWLGKIADELAAFGVVRDASEESIFFAWTSIHGLTDLLAAHPEGKARLPVLVKTHCRHIVTALA